MKVYSASTRLKHLKSSEFSLRKSFHMVMLDETLKSRMSRINKVDRQQKEVIQRYYSSLTDTKTPALSLSGNHQRERTRGVVSRPLLSSSDQWTTSSRASSRTSGIPEKQASAREQAEEVFSELIETEFNYLDRLDDLVKLFVCPLRARAEIRSVKTILTLAEIESIFSNVEAIAFRHRAFLRRLRIIDKAADPLREHFMLCRELYKPYMNEFNACAANLRKARSANPELQDLIKTAEHFSGYPIESLLVEPIQRLPRYSLLMKELVKHMERAGMSLEGLTEAHGELLEAVIELDQISNIADRRQRVAEIEELFHQQVQLSHPHRLWLCEGDVQKLSKSVLKPLKMFLLSDCIVFGKCVKKNYYKMKERINLKSIKISKGTQCLSAITGHPQERIFVINQASKDGQEIVLVAPSVLERDQWISSLKNANDTVNAFPGA